MRDRFFRFVDEQVRASEAVLRKEITAGMERLSNLDSCSSLVESFRRHRDFCMARAILRERLAVCADDLSGDGLREIADSIGGQFCRASMKRLEKTLENAREMEFRIEWLIRRFLAEMSCAAQQSEADGNELGARAINEKLKTRKVTVRCPRCFGRPKVEIWGRYHERMSARCPCGYVCAAEYGI